MQKLYNIRSSPFVHTACRFIVESSHFVLANPCWLFKITFLSFMHLDTASGRLCFITSPRTKVRQTVLLLCRFFFLPYTKVWSLTIFTHHETLKIKVTFQTWWRVALQLHWPAPPVAVVDLLMFSWLWCSLCWILLHSTHSASWTGDLGCPHTECIWKPWWKNISAFSIFFIIVSIEKLAHIFLW